MSVASRCQLCGGPRQLREPEFGRHIASTRHVLAVREWDARHNPRAEQEHDHHYFRRLLKLDCRCEAKVAAA